MKDKVPFFFIELTCEVEESVVMAGIAWFDKYRSQTLLQWTDRPLEMSGRYMSNLEAKGRQGRRQTPETSIGNSSRWERNVHIGSIDHGLFII